MLTFFGMSVFGSLTREKLSIPPYIKDETVVELDLCGFIGKLFGFVILVEFLFRLWF